MDPLTKTLPSLSPTCDAILSWMIEAWMKNHVASDSHCTIVDKLEPVTQNIMYSVAIVKESMPYDIGQHCTNTRCRNLQ